MADRTALRRTFADAAALYDRMRPRYPDPLFSDLALTAGSHVLEIGCGAGQATVALAQRGCAIVAVERSSARCPGQDYAFNTQGQC